jgi:thymidylate synthase ThyX
MSDNPYLLKVEDDFEVTPQGWAALEAMVTDARGQVYAFNGTLSPVIVAAAMARLSRRAGDMRVAILDEFMLSDGQKADELIERVVTQYGDDSVQQLVGVQCVVEGASNLLTKILEWGRLASYLEQSTRYIYFDKPDKDGKFRYFIPSDLNPVVRTLYVQAMDKIFEDYSFMVREMTRYLRRKYPEPADPKERAAWIASTRASACDAIRPVLPVATKSTVGIFASAQAADSLIMHLLSDPLQEAKDVGMQLLRELRKVIPSFLKRTDMPDRGGAITAYRANTRFKVRELAREMLQYEHFLPTSATDVRLAVHWPNDELELVPEMLFESSEPLSLQEIERQVHSWGRDKKMLVFDAYVGQRLNRRHKPGRAFEKAHFEWEIVGDYGTFRDLQRHRMVDSWEWQRLSPELGYDVPALVTEAGLENNFRKCFEVSLSLYRTMGLAGNKLESQYATLLGHRMRYRFLMNTRAKFHFLELRTGPAGHPGYRKLCNTMFESFKTVYPETAQAMRFVNQGEDPVLARMAAELATQYRLEKLEKKE